MVIGDERFRLEIQPLEVLRAPAEGAGDVRAAVAVRCHAFSGANRNVYFQRAAWARFAAELRALERSGRGEAELRSESPNDFRARFYMSDWVRHLGVEGHVGAIAFVGSVAREITLTFEFELDTLLFRPFTDAVEAVLAAAV